MDGRCTCGTIRYRLKSRPMFTHCCHCRWCQRETGTAFALNAMIEADRVELLAGEPDFTTIPTASGKGQKIARCPTCRIALWSNYAGAGEAVRFVRVGTLENPDACPPDMHIFVSSKQPWVVLPGGRQGGAGILSALRNLAGGEFGAVSGAAWLNPDHSVIDIYPSTTYK